MNSFKNDKTAYIFESNENNSEFFAEQFKSEIQYATNSAQSYLDQSKAYQSSEMNTAVKDAPPLSESSTLGYISLKQTHPTLKTIVKTKKNSHEDLDGLISSLFTKVHDKSIFFHGKDILVIERIQNKTTEWALAYAFESESVNNFFETEKSYTSFITDSAGRILRTDKPQSQKEYEPLLAKLYSDGSLAQLGKISTSKIVNDQSEKFLISATSLGFNNLNFTTLVQEKRAFSFIKRLFTQTSLLFIIITCLVIILGSLSASYLTRRLTHLTDAVAKVSEGHFDVQVPVSGKDEISGLSASFNKMTAEIHRLMSETAHKARMETELKTAQLVQSTLFPDSEYENSVVSIKGFYTSASECGGDWWWYHDTPTHLWIWIADATGHGAPAALMTSAAKSATSLIQKNHIEINQAMEQLNYAISSVAKENMMMTCFAASIDKKSLIMTYSNASHEPTFILRKQVGEQELKKKDLEFLNNTNGNRLGQDKTSSYENKQIQLHPGDRIIFYTDGVTDIKNLENKALGERGFIKAILNSQNRFPSSFNDFTTAFDKELSDYRQNSELVDDVTLCFVEVRRV